MSEHEFWNELGNLYFLSGAYDPAIHAYARSIELERDFGRPYSNMALAFVQLGRYADAIGLYHRSIELLHDAKEKAITWNRLGILYRQIKDYHAALVAYEQADKLDPQQDEEREQASRDVKVPLAVSMPALDLNSILSRREPARQDEQPDPATTVSREPAEPRLDIDWFDGDFVSPDPVDEPALGIPSEEHELLEDVSVSMDEAGWTPYVIVEPIAVDFPFGMKVTRDREPVEDWPTPNAALWEAHVEANDREPRQTMAEPEPEDMSDFQRIEVKRMNEDAQIDEPAREDAAENQWVEISGFEIGEPEPAAEESVSEVIESIRAFENISASGNEYEPAGEISVAQDEPKQDESNFAAEPMEPIEPQFEEPEPLSVDVSEPEMVEYSQVEYPLVELSAAEIDSIQIDIARFKRIVQINPRNAFAYDALGGLHKALGRFRDAIAYYQQAVALDSTKPSYFYQLGLMYLAEQREDEAANAFQRVLTIDPQHVLANASLGNLYRKLGWLDLAQQHIENALQFVYEDESEYNLACLEAICGNSDRALELLQSAIEDNPSYINWAQHDPDLDELRRDERFHVLIQSLANNR